jgi:hypothetical protein
MSSPISPLAHALRLLKVELAQARDKRVESKVATEARNPVASPAANQPSQATALRRLPTKLKAIREQGGGLARGKALRLFIEAVLVDELGSELQLDAAFGDLVERTCRAIEQDAGNASLLTDALKELEALAD